MKKAPSHIFAAQISPFSSSSTNVDLQLYQAPWSLATSCHLKPLNFANEFRESSHLVAGRPRARSPPCGIQFTMRVVHLPSVRRRTWPAQFHLRRRCSRTQSMTLPDSIAVSTHQAVRLCHSIHVSCPPSPELWLEVEVDANPDEPDDDDDADDSVAWISPISCSRFTCFLHPKPHTFRSICLSTVRSRISLPLVIVQEPHPYRTVGVITALNNLSLSANE